MVINRYLTLALIAFMVGCTLVSHVSNVDAGAGTPHLRVPPSALKEQVSLCLDLERDVVVVGVRCR